MRLTDRLGEKYGRLTVIERAPNKSAKDTNARWLCRCQCGKECVVYGQDLAKGRQVSCGCYNLERITTHGMSRTHVNAVWRMMRDRCTNPNNPAYKNYGGRGITVDARWDSFKTFHEDMGERPEGYTLERIDNSKGYSKENCKWVTMTDQLNNRRNNHLVTYNGETHTVAEWAKITGIKWDTLRSRIDRYGWTIERALTTKVKQFKPLHWGFFNLKDKYYGNTIYRHP